MDTGKPRKTCVEVAGRRTFRTLLSTGCAKIKKKNSGAKGLRYEVIKKKTGTGLLIKTLVLIKQDWGQTYVLKSINYLAFSARTDHVPCTLALFHAQFPQITSSCHIGHMFL